VGTSLGYCIYFNKPHYLIKQEYAYEVDTLAKENMEKLKLAEMKQGIFFDIFGEFRETITNDQYNIVDKCWGISCVKNKTELKEIFDNYEKMYHEKN
jgi:hypothetical protein